MSKIELGIHPIGWTNDDMPELGDENTFEQCISEMALAGYTGTEIGHKYPRDPAELHSYLDPRGLRVTSCWTSLFLTTKPYEETEKDFIAQCEFLQAMGAKCVVVSEQGHSIQGQTETSIFDEKPVFTDEEWDRLTAGLERLADVAAPYGLKIAFHHHMGTGVQTAEEIDRLMAATDPSKVFLLLDTGHLVFSGEDPMDIATRYLDRIIHVHLKDIRGPELKQAHEEKQSFLGAIRNGVFTVPGDGIVDVASVMSLFRDSDYEGWFVVEAEQDPAKANPFTYATMARKYIEETIGI